MRLCWPNKFGDWRQTKTLYFSDSLKQNFFQMDQYLMSRKKMVPMLEGVYSKGVKSL